MLRLVTPADLAFEELDHDFARLQRADFHSVEQRSALSGVLNALYRLREESKSAFGKHPACYAFAAETADGRTTEGIVGLRGMHVHAFAQPLAPQDAPLYPCSDTYPGAYTFPGANLTWVDPDEASGELHLSRIDASALARYREGAMGQMVLYTLSDSLTSGGSSAHTSTADTQGGAQVSIPIRHAGGP